MMFMTPPCRTWTSLSHYSLPSVHSLHYILLLILI